MNLLTDNFTINLSPLSLVAFVVVLVLAGLGVYAFYKSRKEKSSRQKTGFLGKPLLQFSALFIMLAAVAGVYFLSEEETGVLIEAEKQVKIEIEHKVLSSEGNKRTVQFRATPIVDGDAWGAEGDRFDIIWNIRPSAEVESKGQEQVDFFEVSKSSEDTSEYVTTLLSGSYSLKLIVSIEGESFEEIKDIEI